MKKGTDMRAFLMWRLSAGTAERRPPERILRKSKSFLGPMFGAGLTIRDESNEAVNLIVADQPVLSCHLEFAQEDELTQALAIDYPLNARVAMASRAPLHPASLLPRLCRELERSPESLLRELAPPFSLIWFSKRNERAKLQVDGLGQSPLFEYDDGRLWAVTNHLMWLQTLGVDLEPVAEEWATWSAAGGWFPMSLTGFRNVTRVGPGTRFEIDGAGVRRVAFDVLEDWIHPASRPLEAWLESGRQSVLEILKEVVSVAGDFHVGLSGGWDSRAVVSSLSAVKAKFRPKVKGSPGSSDVVCASELARRAGLDLIVSHHSEPAGNDWQDSAHSVALALQWQAGEMDVDKHKTLFARGRRFLPVSINIMGQHGELVRGRFYDKPLRENRIPEDIPDSEIEEATVRGYLNRLPPFVRPGLAERVRDMLFATLRQADGYQLHGLARLDFHYLHEYTRRRNSGSLAAQNDLVVAPFLNPEIIRCCFASSPEDKAHLKFHRYMIERNEPGWIDAPFAQMTAPFEFAEEAREDDPVRAAEAFFVRTVRDSRYFDAVNWWKTEGAPLLEDAMGAEGFLAEVFEPPAMRRMGTAAPDEIVVLAALTKMIGVEQPAAV
ncbi:MAG TPA: hypothetical protein VMA34_07880 [Terracidiphilus sp.]|nr:hypothetical protein [Terracidiphilus sp.]